MAKNPEDNEALLTQAQSAALPLLAAGAKKKDAAAAAGVCAQTVSEWLHESHFSAVLDSQRSKLTSLAVERMKALAGQAVETLVELMESSSETIRFKAATYLLDRAALLASPESVVATSANKQDLRQSLAVLL